jgi:hypothetical protein
VYGHTHVSPYEQSEWYDDGNTLNHVTTICHKCSQGSSSMVNITSSWYDEHTVWYHDILNDGESLKISHIYSNYLTPWYSEWQLSEKLTARHVKRVMVRSWICYLLLLLKISICQPRNLKNFPDYSQKSGNKAFCHKD